MFRVGQRVVCVDDKWDMTRDSAHLETNPVKNGIYTIRSFGTSGCLLLVEIKNPVLNYSNGTMEKGFRASRFRPLVDDNFAEELLAKIKEDVQSEFQLNQ